MKVHMTGCMNGHKGADERPHRQGHSSEFAQTRPGMNKRMIGGHKERTKNIGEQNMRAENGQKEQKGIGLIIHIHPFWLSWSYQFGALVVCRTNYMWSEHHTNQIVRDKLDAKLIKGPQKWWCIFGHNLVSLQGISPSAVGYNFSLWKFEFK